jgi:Caenorhabditis protein of unknown function, DUF268
MPCLHDWYEEGGATNSEYFWQDLLVARMINTAVPDKHVDVGSRVDGFVAHVASFREIEVFDIRAITSEIPGVIFRQADLMSEESISHFGGDYCESLSCLHALEHFGLGRYGDDISCSGAEMGMTNMASIIKSGGIMYLSTPIGKERVEYNAHRVFSVDTILGYAEGCGLRLRELRLIHSRDDYAGTAVTKEEMMALQDIEYTLGLFIFMKL